MLVFLYNLSMKHLELIANPFFLKCQKHICMFDHNFFVRGRRARLVANGAQRRGGGPTGLFAAVYGADRTLPSSTRACAIAQPPFALFWTQPTPRRRTHRPPPLDQTSALDLVVGLAFRCWSGSIRLGHALRYSCAPR